MKSPRRPQETAMTRSRKPLTERNLLRTFDQALRAFGRAMVELEKLPPATVEVAYVDQDGGEGTERFATREEAMAWVKARRCASASFSDITPNA
jgi:hypothetical protein